MAPMKIAIDARVLAPPISGVRRYAANLVATLGRIDAENEYIVFLRNGSAAELLEECGFAAGAGNTTLVYDDSSIYNPLAARRVPAHAKKQGAEVFHSLDICWPASGSLPIVQTIHDLIPILYREYLPKSLKVRLGFLFKRLAAGCIRGAKRVIAGSEYTKKDIIRAFGTEAEKISVGYYGVKAPDGIVDAEPTLAKLGIERPYFLYVGRHDRHKNLRLLIEGLSKAEFASTPPNLVIAGKTDKRYDDCRCYAGKLDMHERVVATGYLPESDIEALYGGALAFIYPSLVEGFGLPPVEAMARGVPVASSRATALAEAVGDAALEIDPHDAASVARAMERLASDEGLRAELSKKGIEHAARFTWEKTAERTIAVYEAAR